MFKRIRDYIYDINDIFIALMIIIVAAGIIVWRSTTIMAYPEYLAAKAEAANVVTPIDAVPAPTNSTTNQNNAVNTSPNTGSQNTEQNTGSGTEAADNTQTTPPDSQQGTESPDNSGGTQGGQAVVTANIEIEFGFRGNWYTVADRIIATGVLAPEDREAFYNTVLALDLGRSLQIGTFELSSDMTHEQMIRTLCGQH